MPGITTNRLLFFVLFVLSQTIQFSFAQPSSYPIKQWVKKLGAEDAPVLSGFTEIFPVVTAKDSSTAFELLNAIEKEGNASNHYFTCRLSFIKAVYANNARSSQKALMNYVNKSVDAAYETENDSLISTVCWQYGSMMYYVGQIELASLYCVNGAEIDERIGRKISSTQYGLISDVMYRTRDNEKCIHYAKKVIELETDTAYASRDKVMSQFNTIGLCWKRTGNHDSASFYLDKAMSVAQELGDPIWQSIISGNKGQIYYSQQKYALAKPLLEYDYRFSKEYGEFGSAANSLQWVARINLMEGKKDSALIQVREALELEKRNPNSNYLQNIAFTAADVYRAIGNNDSAFKYAQLYNHLHDSIEGAVALSKVEISRIKLDNLQNVFTIKNLNRVKQAEELKRNFFIAAIILVTIIALLYVNRVRLKFRHKEQLAAEQQKRTNEEMAAAQEQLQLFTQNIIEKTSLIEQLQEQLNHRSLTLEQQQLVSGISNFTILTETDWEKFKTIFEKIYPGFFIHLKEKVTDITLAEQRMAALTRLQLSINQIASILGISPNSVYKTKQRLRQRLHLDTEKSIEEMLTTI
jgi:DNA-binding CsgD family transcriptional regulator